jgi:hypothetical protein
MKTQWQYGLALARGKRLLTLISVNAPAQIGHALHRVHFSGIPREEECGAGRRLRGVWCGREAMPMLYSQC